MSMDRQMHTRFVLDTSEHDAQHSDDDLPDYELSELPTYERSSVSVPSMNLRFRQVKAKVITLESLDEERPVSYTIANKGGPRLFSSKPEMNLIVNTDSKDISVAGFGFDNSSSLPWVPRARLTVDVAGGGCNVVMMEARNFADWKLEYEGRRFAWTLQERPTSLALVDLGTGVPLARFTYSKYGTTATKSAEIGDLAIFTPTEYNMGTEIVICSCTIAMKYWAKLGRHHRQGNSTSGRYSYGNGITLASSYPTSNPLSLRYT